MEGRPRLAPGTAHRACRALPDGTLLNRYWDDRATPRDESYLEDVETAQHTQARRREVYRDLRAGAATRMGFQLALARLMGGTLATIRTTAIAAGGSQRLLFQLETDRWRGPIGKGRRGQAPPLRAASGERAASPSDRLMWNEQDGIFADYDWEISSGPRHA